MRSRRKKVPELKLRGSVKDEASTGVSKLTKAFISYRLIHGVLAEMNADEFPSCLYAWNDGTLNLSSNGTHFGYVWKGKSVLNSRTSGVFTLKSGMYFSLPGSGTLFGGQGIVITRLNYQGVFSIGGPVEPSGRLRYIDGSSDNLLIPPVLKGDPCLNALYFPPGIKQTMHLHDSIRIGMIVSGQGECITPEETISLEPGQVFLIPTNSLHSFQTTDKLMVCIIYHPDSNYGPTHENHPMILKTIVNGKSASLIPEIQTR